MTPQTLWQGLCTTRWRLSVEDAQAWWVALQGAQSPAPVTLRRHVRQLAGQRVDRRILHRLVWRRLTPQQCVLACNALVEEGLLSRALANYYQQAVLAQIAADGQWKGPRHGSECP